MCILFTRNRSPQGLYMYNDFGSLGLLSLLNSLSLEAIFPSNCCCVKSTSLCLSFTAASAASVRAPPWGCRLRNWEAETGEAEWGQSTKLLVLKMAWGFYGSGKRFRSRLGSLSSVSIRGMAVRVVEFSNGGYKIKKIYCNPLQGQYRVFPV